jgi:hypothetical protein
MKYKIDYENKTVLIYSSLSTTETSEILNYLANYEREMSCDYKWNFKVEIKEKIPTYAF